ncbi:hypothetical protein O6H91_14G001800 [Diphasiastrum complanatum]|uniref:Uncharacterized protein n=1 Tax=Diphasiastrum complanatum TaxID=34168 RepID=A0ACC2BKY4_DIPCM|nr:hypothetical protein O6H91_14G001800 [Diphasiastrum complanatum]
MAHQHDAPGWYIGLLLLKTGCLQCAEGCKRYLMQYPSLEASQWHVFHQSQILLRQYLICPHNLNVAKPFGSPVHEQHTSSCS